MREWIKKWESFSNRAKAAAHAAQRQTGDVSGKYGSLYKYLEHRYANTVVLTFGQIEDLLGFALPDLARTHQEWWTMTDAKADKSPHSDAWIVAGRTARPNLLAQNVVFERTLSLGRPLH
jgi:hypothetical protein